MARGRMIDSSLIQNEKVAEMPLAARWLLVGMICSADDQGRLKANPILLSNTIFPYEEISGAQVEEWLLMLQANGTILVYVADGKQYAQFKNWWEYQSLQFAHPSNYPKPAGWVDRVRYTSGKGQGMILTCNWVRNDGSSSDDTCDEDGKPIKPPAQPPAQPPAEADAEAATRTTKLNLTKLNLTEEQTTTTPLPPTQTANSGGGGGDAHPVESSSEPNSPKTTVPVKAQVATLPVEPVTANAAPPVATPPQAAEPDPLAELSNLLLANGFGELRPATQPQVLGWVSMYQLATIQEAIRTAVANGKSSLNYVEGVLKGNGRPSTRAAGFGSFGQAGQGKGTEAHGSNQTSGNGSYAPLSDEQKRRLRAERKAENDRIRAEMSTTMH